MNLFAYGTLMTADGFRAVLGARAGALAFRVARLPGWRRVWNVFREDWGGGVLNVERREGSAVVGVLVEGLAEADFEVLDRCEANHLPRESVIVEPEDGEPVPAELYWRRQGNHAGRPSPRYLGVVLERARQAGPSVLENLRTASVDATGGPANLP
jgi:hypothetical protein